MMMMCVCVSLFVGQREREKKEISPEFVSRCCCPGNTNF